MTKRPILIDDNVEDIRRVRHEISSQFKTLADYWRYVMKIERASIRREKRESDPKELSLPGASVLSGETPVLIDDNVEDIRRVRREISSRFKTDREFLDYVMQLDQDRLRREKRELAMKKSSIRKLHPSPAKSKRKVV